MPERPAAAKLAEPGATPDQPKVSKKGEKKAQKAQEKKDRKEQPKPAKIGGKPFENSLALGQEAERFIRLENLRSLCQNSG